MFAAAWLATLAARPLYKTDEARYGEISREMAQSGDWVTPRLNGLKYFEKPPLQYWAGAAALKVFGVHDWAARLWTGLLALAGVALAFIAGRRLFGAPAGPAAAAILAGCPLFIAFGQFNTLDMGVSVFLAAAVFAFAIGQSPRLFTEETSEGFWIEPAAGIKRYEADEMPMAEPGESGLRYLAGFPSLEALWQFHADGRHKFHGIGDRLVEKGVRVRRPRGAPAKPE